MKQVLKQGLRSAIKVLIWLLVLAVVCLPARYMNTVYGYLPPLLLVVLTLGSMLWMTRLRRAISVRAESSDIQCERGKRVTIGIRLENRSRLVCPKAKAHICISDLFGDHDEQRTVTFTLPGKESLDLSFQLEMPHIGCYRVGLSGIEIYDLLGVFRTKVSMVGELTAVVTPRIRSMEQRHDFENLLTETANDTRTTVVGGTDYTGVRSYALGDPMKQIHWKLSAHSREYMTKLQESSRQQEFSVLLDSTATGKLNAEQMMDLNDCIVETALSLIASLSDGDVSCALYYCDRSGSTIRTMPTGREDDVELIRSFAPITVDPPSSFPDACRMLQQEGQGQNRSSNVAVVTSRITSELIQELQLTRRWRRSPELYLIVPAEWSSRELELACLPLKQLDDMEIPCFVISTAVNRIGGGEE